MINNNLEKLMALSKGVTIATNAYSKNALDERRSLERLYSLMKLADCHDERLILATLQNISYTIDKAEVVGKIFGCFIAALEAAGIRIDNKNAENDN